MKRSKLRTVLLALLFVACCAIVLFKVVESQWTDTSLAGQTRRLQSGWTYQRRAAAADLAQFAGEAERVAPELVKALRDPDKEVRANSLQSLKAIDKLPVEAAPALVDVLQNDQDPAVRRDAASLLGMIKVPGATTALIAAIDDRDPGVRGAALNALTFHGASPASEPAIDKLIALVTSSQPEDVRLAGVQALGSVGRNQERVARTWPGILANDPSPVVRDSAVLLLMNTKFGFEIPAMIAALEDQSAQVRLTAGSCLGAIGLKDERIVPALCRAARKADEMTREGIGTNIGKLRWDPPADGAAAEQTTQKFQAAVRELRSLLDHKESAARMETVMVLARLAANYQSTKHITLLEPAREAVQIVLARALDEHEETPLRLHAINQWSYIQPPRSRAALTRRPAGDSPAASKPLNIRAEWLTALATALKSPSESIRMRAGEILLDALKDPCVHAEDWLEVAWRNMVPSLAAATKSDDVRIRSGAVAILELLGPEAAEAVSTLKALTAGSQDSAIRAAAERAIDSISCAEHLKASDPKIRVAACQTLSRLAWRATPALPALTAAIEDRAAEVRLAAAQSLRELGSVSTAAVTPLATALPRDPDAAVRASIVNALEAIAPGTRAVVDAHMNALRDADPSVRKAGATFQKVPADDSVVSALGAALGDSDEGVRTKVAASLMDILFSNPAVIPTLCKSLRDPAQRQAAVDALGNHLANMSDPADFSRVRSNIRGLRSTLAVAIPALTELISLKNDEISTLTYSLLGRIVSFARMSRDENLRKAIEPALNAYLRGLEEPIAAVREEVLAGIDEVPIRRADIVAALQKFLEKPDLTADERASASRAVKTLSEPAKSKSGQGSG